MSLTSSSSRRRRISGRFSCASLSAVSRLSGASSNEGESVGSSAFDQSGESGSLMSRFLSVFSANVTCWLASSSDDSRVESSVSISARCKGAEAPAATLASVRRKFSCASFTFAIWFCSLRSAKTKSQ